MSHDPREPVQVRQHDIPPDVREDPRGMWQVILGAAVAVLAPLGGFLGGTIAGPTGPGQIDTVLAWLIGGIVVGGAGALVALVGGLRWHRHVRTQQAPDPDLQRAR